MFVMIGAEPRTSWLPGSIERDGEGCSRPGTCGTGPSSVSPRPWGKALPPSSLCTNSCGPSKTDAEAGLRGGVLLSRERRDELGPGVNVELAIDLAQVELDRLGR